MAGGACQPTWSGGSVLISNRPLCSLSFAMGTSEQEDCVFTSTPQPLISYPFLKALICKVLFKFL